jgi:hypothetical protein
MSNKFPNKVLHDWPLSALVEFLLFLLFQDVTQGFGFNGLRFIDFATGDVTSRSVTSCVSFVLAFPPAVTFVVFVCCA